MDCARTTVSVVIPCYNGGRYLPEALDSALAQTHPPAEVIVVDDGSRDDSAAVAQAYIDAHPGRGLRLIRRENGGEPAARNTGIAAATGDWIAMLDADDWWESAKLEKQLATATAAGLECVMVHAGVIHHFPDGRTEKKDLTPAARRTGWATAALLERGSIGHPSIIVRRDALARIGGYDESFKQACDIDLYWRLSAVGTFAFVPEHLLHYRIHPGQMSVRPAEQIGYHHRAIRNFFAAHPRKLQEIGQGKVDAFVAGLIADKLRSLYWRRRLDQFRLLLEYAAQQGLDSADIRRWRGRARYPDWVIRLKDRLAPVKGRGA